MTAQLPSKDLLLEACTGLVVHPHPILRAAYQLASLHEARRATDAPPITEIDSARAALTRDVDRWIARELPRPHAAATLHTETVGMVVDRIARYSVDAHSALDHPDSATALHYAWQRLVELSLAYADLAHDLTERTRRIPDCLTPQPDDLQPQ
ncbi:DUF4254 domain-containing protein [Nocardia tengchongensis]|uniref:DUF4254 domain-containing protein n=1 Tax=Nocardia tengchongensis TaxID=2055889 RepID=UPI003617573B